MTSHRQRGAALLLVLGALILISVIVIGFLFTVRQDRNASSYYQSGASARQYADTAINIAIAQIAEATSNPNLAWISQPGLLRTFNASGQVAAYKLYSSGTMKGDASYDPVTAADREIPAGWASRPDEFVDLNRPIITAAGTVYPIADPAATDTTNPSNPPITSGTNPNWLAEGFSYDNTSVKETDNILPMPVRWIYVRKDGSLVDYGTAQTADDIVARVAFWGDDETSKVNINTASEGVFYDPPSYYSRQDYWLGVTQPLAQEYQRYPGHPATTSLSAVFKPLRDIPEDDLMSRYTAFGSSISRGPAARSIAATAITPRISSVGFTGASNTAGSDGGRFMGWLGGNGVMPDSDRLFASIDELSYQRDAITKNWNTTLGARYPNTTLDLKPLQFFLTTDSRAPELTLLNRPRVTLWPFNVDLVANPNGLTPEDRLIKLASELGTNQRKLYFQRDNAWDPSRDYTDIFENQDLYAYLQWATRQEMPTASASRAVAGASLQSKFGLLGRDQIITQIFDYLRGYVNNINYGYVPVSGPTYSFPQNGHPPGTDGVMVQGYNDITPLLIDAGNGLTKGFSSPTISDVVFQFYNAGEYYSGQTFSGTVSYGTISGTATDTKTFSTSGVESAGADAKPDYIIRRVQLVCLFNLFGVMNSPGIFNQRFQVRITGTPFGFTSSDSKIMMRFEGESDTDWRSTIADIGFPGGQLNTTLVCGQGGDWGRGTGHGGSKGDSLGLSYAMIFDSVNNMANVDTQSQAKTLTSQLAGAKRYFDGAAITGNAAKYQIYPFVSKVVEFRIPNTKGTTAPASPFPTDDITVQWTGSPDFKIEIFPGLKRVGATYKDNFQYDAPDFEVWDVNTTTPLATMQIGENGVEGAEIPLPLLGDSAKSYIKASWDLWKVKGPGDTTGYWPRNPLLFPPTTDGASYPSRKEMQYYPARFRNWYKDYLIKVPRNGGGNQDVIRTYSLDGASESYGDLRLAAYRHIVPPRWWKQAAGYTTKTQFVALNQPLIDSDDYWSVAPNAGRLLKNLAFPGMTRNTTGNLNGVIRKDQFASTISKIGDFTTGYGFFAGGAAITGPDVGATTWSNPYNPGDNGGPYFGNGVTVRASSQDVVSSVFHLNLYGITFSPFKQMPSAVMFGSMPARALEDPAAPWETLLFCPNPAEGAGTHRGWAQKPRDHYWLDLFYMPVVEPYAITENFATNGKVNLNYQIAPFTYIQRKTALYALLRNMQVAAVANGESGKFKPANDDAKYNAITTAANYRTRVDVAETLKGFDSRFTANDPFVSSSEICEMSLVPAGQTLALIQNFWTGKELTGDDRRESPYNALYPRVTTRSNSFKVHFIAQTLKGRTGRWNVVGQYRGSQVVERFLDGFSGGPNARRVYGSISSGSSPDTQFPALAGNAPDGFPYYRFRKVSHQQFSP